VPWKLCILNISGTAVTRILAKCCFTNVVWTVCYWRRLANSEQKTCTTVNTWWWKVAKHTNNWNTVGNFCCVCASDRWSSALEPVLSLNSPCIDSCNTVHSRVKLVRFSAGDFVFVRYLHAHRVPLEIERMSEQVLGLLLQQLFGLLLFLNHPCLFLSLLAPASLVVIHLSEQVRTTLEFLLAFSQSLLVLGLTRCLDFLQKHLSVSLTIFFCHHRLLLCRSQQTTLTHTSYFKDVFEDSVLAHTTLRPRWRPDHSRSWPDVHEDQPSPIQLLKEKGN